MISKATQSAALGLFQEAVKDSNSNDPNIRDRARAKGRMAWELMHLHKVFGGFDFYKPDPDDPDPIWPWPWPPRHPFPIPDPTPWAAHLELQVKIIESLQGDPNPQPDFPNVLTDQKLKLEAAESLSGRLKQALENLDGIVLPMFREE